MKKELRDKLIKAGFPGSENWIDFQVYGDGEFFEPSIISLMNVCNGMADNLDLIDGRWVCGKEENISYGSSMHESVGELWLKLNTK